MSQSLSDPLAAPAEEIPALQPDYQLAHEVLALLEQMAQHSPLPSVRALHLPPPPPADGERGEFCALELEGEGSGGAIDRHLGLSYVLLGDTWAQLDRRAKAGDGPTAGSDPLDLARLWLEPEPWCQAVGLAAVNALTRCLFDRAGWQPDPSVDSIGHLGLQAGDLLGMIGFFGPLVPRLRSRGIRLLVAELRPELVKDEDGLRVTLDRRELAKCQQVLATGTLLMSHTLEPMLACCTQARRLALVGPSVGLPPDPLLARGVSLLGGSWVVDNEAAIAAIRAGKPLGDSARKVAVTAQDYPGWSALLARC